MADTKIIEQQLKDIGLSFIERLGKAKTLASALDGDEQVKGLVTGFYNNTGGCLVSTDKRLLFIKQGLTKSVEQFTYDKVTSVEYSEGPLADAISLTAFNERRTIEKVPRRKAKPFCDTVNQLLSKS